VLLSTVAQLAPYNGCGGQPSVPERHGQVMHGDSANGAVINAACHELLLLFADKTLLPGIDQLIVVTRLPSRLFSNQSNILQLA
jgi:hypothetical protein